MIDDVACILLLMIDDSDDDCSMYTDDDCSMYTVILLTTCIPLLT